MLTHRNLLAMTSAYLADVDTIAPGDAILHAAPMSHGSGLYILPHAARGACQCAARAAASIRPRSSAAADAPAARAGITLFAAPTMVKRLAEHPDAGRSTHAA